MSIPNTIGNPSRRTVLCGVAAALAAGGVVTTACGAQQSAAGGTTAGTSQSSSTSNTGQPGGQGTVVGKVADVPIGGGVVVPGPNGKLVLVQPTSGEIMAFNAACPHRQVIVAAPKDGTITCPGHGSQFDGATGALKRGPAKTGLTSVAVKVDGANVVLA